MPLKDPFGSIAPGELRHRVTFQSKSVTTDSYGAEVIDWADVMTCWARIEPMQGHELWTSQQLYPESNTKITVRGNIGKLLDVTMRATFKGRQFDLMNFSDIDERGIEAVITAIERPIGRNV